MYVHTTVNYIVEKLISQLFLNNVLKNKTSIIVQHC